MDRFSLFAVGLVVVSACAAEEQPAPRFTGIVRVTERVEATQSINSASIFGKIDDPSGFEPTASLEGCDYFGEQPGAGISMGTLSVSGLVAPVVVEPSSFFDGELYVESLEPDSIPEGALIVATFTQPNTSADPVSIEAVAPAALAAVTMPETVVLTSSPTITWQAGSGDEVAVTLRVDGLGTSQTITCLTQDTGTFTFPPGVLAMIDGTESQGSLSITRANGGTTVDNQPQVDAELKLAVQSEVFRTVALSR